LRAYNIPTTDAALGEEFDVLRRLAEARLA
jgi:hypothetical protein